MNRIFCNCLNIILDVNVENSRKIVGANLLRDEEAAELEETFFKSDVLDIKLGLGGVEIQQTMLIQERIVDDWKIFHCTNCELDTHAVHKVKGLERVLGNLKLQRSVEDVQTLKDNPGYSPVFKIVLDRNSLTEDKGSTAQTAFILQQCLSEAAQMVNNTMKKFLKLQEEAMQERIRLYTEQEKQKFDDLQNKAILDKKTFLRILCQKEEKNMKDSLSEAMEETGFRIGSADERSDSFPLNIPKCKTSGKYNGRLIKSEPNFNLTGSLPLTREAPIPSRILGNKAKEVPSKRTRSPTKPQSMRRRIKPEVDEDTLFDLEGFQDNRHCQPFFESDEDSSGDSNSLEGSGGFGFPIRGFPPDRVFASSVPVGIPYIEAARKQSYDDDDEGDQGVAPSPEKMAESIKAIARSIQDSTSMFGDLPRPRYNTLPLK